MLEGLLLAGDCPTPTRWSPSDSYALQTAGLDQLLPAPFGARFEVLNFP